MYASIIYESFGVNFTHDSENTERKETAARTERDNFKRISTISRNQLLLLATLLRYNDDNRGKYGQLPAKKIEEVSIS